MTQQQRMRLSTVVLDAPNASELADFYRRLLGWGIKVDEGDWVLLERPDGGTSLSFQTEPFYVRPVWPGVEGEQLMMLHLDIEVDDLDVAGAHAIAQGAVLAEFQPQDDVRVYLDPAGHPFCLWIVT
jgi:catechol 2,3-dioxygenase-like lactoylglutathione lyase family enzyme